MPITTLGKNLNIVILCDYGISHEWMSFLCWYSISKNLPDASVVLLCSRKQMTRDLFTWAKRCGVRCIFHKDIDLENRINFLKTCGLTEPVIVVDPHTVCIRDFEETKINLETLEGMILANSHSDILCDCKDKEISLFASYLNGWGNFVYKNWIDKETCPLIVNLDFKSSDMTVNESRIRSLWNSAIFLFNNVSRG